MGYVYRYTDLEDNVIKYVGIVWSDKRELAQRIYEHSLYDWWCQDTLWKIEYIETPINTRTDAEYMESHFISLFHTGMTENGYNTKKDGWGVSSFIKENWDWEEYVDCGIPKTTYKLNTNIYKKIKFDSRYKLIQENIFDKVNMICNHIIGANQRSFSNDYKIPEQFCNIYYKDGTVKEIIHCKKTKKRPNGKLKFVYTFTEFEAKEMLEYLCKCYGYKFIKEKDGCAFEDYYNYIST